MATNRDLTSPVEMRRMSMKISTVFHLRGHFPLCTKPGTRNNCPHFNFNGTCIKYFCQRWEIIVFVAMISTEWQYFQLRWICNFNRCCSAFDFIATGRCSTSLLRARREPWGILSDYLWPTCYYVTSDINGRCGPKFQIEAREQRHRIIKFNVQPPTSDMGPV